LERRIFVMSKNSGEGSMHVRFAGLQLLYIASLNAPVPHPISSHDKLDGTLSHSRKRGAINLLHLPIKYSYGSPLFQESFVIVN